MVAKFAVIAKWNTGEGEWSLLAPMDREAWFLSWGQIPYGDTPIDDNVWDGYIEKQDESNLLLLPSSDEPGDNVFFIGEPGELTVSVPGAGDKKSGEWRTWLHESQKAVIASVLRDVLFQTGPPRGPSSLSPTWHIDARAHILLGLTPWFQPITGFVEWFEQQIVKETVEM